MFLNLMLIIIILATAGGVLFLLFRKRATEDYNVEDTVVDVYALDYLTEGIIDVFNKVLKTNVVDLNLNRRETEKAAMVTSERKSL